MQTELGVSETVSLIRIQMLDDYRMQGVLYTVVGDPLVKLYLEYTVDLAYQPRVLLTFRLSTSQGTYPFH